MHQSTKQAPKSCSCPMCRRGKATEPGHVQRKKEERAFRHNAKQVLAKGAEHLLPAPYGSFTD